ncbi:MAG: UDP-N-acetylmuramate dehydrogenase [candidate division WOR-3 bacterium]
MQRAFEALIRKEFPLLRVSLVATKGVTKFFVEPNTIEELVRILECVEVQGLPFFVVGASANTLWGDGFFNGVVISTRKLTRIERLSESLVKVYSGVKFNELIRYCASIGLSGLELLYGIPGTIGGALVMNAGAFGCCVSDCLKEVEVYTCKGNVEKLIRDEIQFDYRRSSLRKYVILSAVFELKKDETALIRKRMVDVINIRKMKFPKGSTLGSVFKNPGTHFAGELIELAGLKGYRIGSSYISTKHANFFISDRFGCATDYVKLIEFVKEKVLKEFNVTLEEEIVYAGVFAG